MYFSLFIIFGRLGISDYFKKIHLDFLSIFEDTIYTLISVLLPFCKWFYLKMAIRY